MATGNEESGDAIDRNTGGIGQQQQQQQQQQSQQPQPQPQPQQQQPQSQQHQQPQQQRQQQRQPQQYEETVGGGIGLNSAGSGNFGVNSDIEESQVPPIPEIFRSYLDELVRDLRTLSSIQMSSPGLIRCAHMLILNEIDRVWNLLHNGLPPHEPWIPSTPEQPQHIVPVASGRASVATSGGAGGALGTAVGIPVDSFAADEELIELTEKIPIPRDPACNYIGRILGPRGISVKQLEAETDCRILVRGKGSVKDPRREARLRSQAGWEHLAEPLHVRVTALDVTREQCEAKLQRAVSSIRHLLTTNNDEYKRQQLIQLAIINGTYRPDGPAMSRSP